MPEAVIVAATRSPIGRANKGSLASMRPDDLAAQVVKASLDMVPELNPSEISDLHLGNAQPAGEAGYNLARAVSVLLGHDNIPGTTVNRYCASSVQAARMAFHAIKAGEGDAYIAAGVETVSRYGAGRADQMPDTKNPLFDDAIARSTDRAQAGEVWRDPRADGTLPNVYLSMGLTAENVASLRGITRREMDEFAVRSQNRAVAAIDDGFWSREITPVTLQDGTVVSADDGPRRGTTYETVSALEPVFRPGGTVTAANCCPMNDGAASLVIMSDIRARELGITPLARIVSTAASGLSPEIMGLGPVRATQIALKNAGLSIDDIDLVEINEAFAAQVIPSARELGIDFDRLNTRGGAIALGHPYGSTGARIATTLFIALHTDDKQFGLETMCVGGGQGMAMIIERLS
jgi:acetyl-CoA C-acetyltransferase